jgi:hypothetical protein
MLFRRLHVLFSRYINCIILPTTSLVDEMPICYFKIDVVLWWTELTFDTHHVKKIAKATVPPTGTPSIISTWAMLRKLCIFTMILNN